MNRLNIFTVCTDAYRQYIPILFRSIDNLKELEDIYELNFVYISDEAIELPEIEYKIKINYIHVAHYPYPFNSYLTFALLDDAIKILNIQSDEKFIFVDADSFFMKKDNFYKNELVSLLNENKICFPISPWNGQEYIFTENRSNSKNSAYIPNCNYSKYIQGSLYFGDIRSLQDFSEQANKLIKHISTEEKVIPSIHNQSIINKIVFMDDKKYIVDHFIFNAYERINPIDNPNIVYSDFSDVSLASCNKKYVLNSYPYHFVIQKYNTNIKKPLK